MCYSGSCQWEIQNGEHAGECRKPSRFACPRDDEPDDAPGDDTPLADEDFDIDDFREDHYHGE